MTVETVKTVATRFLTSEEPGVLALKGAWGVGKTYAWNQLVRENRDKVALPYYCYVSLFGISSATELRTTVFAKSQNVYLQGQAPDERSIKDRLLGLKRWFPGVLTVAREVPYVKGISVGLETVAPHLIRKTIVCLDDFERLDQKRITPDEVLGFISELKEEKQCKVVLIFNEDKLENKEVYEKYREKIIDIELLFAPTADEAAANAFPVDLPSREAVKRCAAALNIGNIRILRKVASLIRMMHKEVQSLHPNVMQQAVNTVVLLAWCYYAGDEDKPTLAFVNEWNQTLAQLDAREDKKADPKVARWSSLLQGYGLLWIDDFDRAIQKVIERGYLEETDFVKEAQKLDARCRNNESAQLFEDAWRLFHDSLADNQAELIEKLGDSVRSAVRTISPMNLSGTTTLLRQLDRGKLADELIDYYIGARADEPGLFNLRESSFGEHVTDPTLRARFDQVYAAIHAKLSLEEAVTHIVRTDGWSDAHIAALQQATEDDFFRLFKGEHGKVLHAIVKSCLRFETLDDYKLIGQRARAALTRIGKESRLNATRVSRYGIRIDPLEFEPPRP